MFLDDNSHDIRRYLQLTEGFLPTGVEVEIEEEPVPASAPDTLPIILADLSDLVFKLQSFMETEGGDYALGVETGMQRAADMIENLVRQHTEKGQQYLG